MRGNLNFLLFRLNFDFLQDHQFENHNFLLQMSESRGCP
jgi:hypothetical protein